MTARRSTSRSRRCCWRPGRTVATAESCTGGLVAARLTDRPAPPPTCAAASSSTRTTSRPTIAGRGPGADRAARRRLARGRAGARRRRDREVRRRRRRGDHRIAGPDGGTEEKPVGLVWISVAEHGGARIDRKVNLPGTAPMCATAPRRSPCICCGASCSVSATSTCEHRAALRRAGTAGHGAGRAGALGPRGISPPITRCARSARTRCT